MIAFIVNFFISLSLIIIGLKHLLRSLYRKKYSTTNAKVVSFERELDAEHLIKYPIIEYVAENRKIVAKIEFGMSLFSWKIGDELQVFYKPNNPDIFFIWDSRAKLLTALLIFFGVIFFVIGFRFF